ncbi:GNAT family N-acetyltransferase [Sanguibacter sp. A247]|uniref:GNAT family N-acetyltransferase n=1 Tax=unclassified Sanguibacter TaxID=2645534 RepID=UPI003FD842BF
MEHDRTFSGHGFRLEPLAQKHVGELSRMVDADMWAGMSTPVPEGEVGMMNYIEDSLFLEGCYPFAVVDAISGEVRGSTALVAHDAVARRVEIGRTFYDRALWGRLINPAVKFLLLEHAFDALGVYRVSLRADARNTRSLAAIERLGATREGTLRGFRDAPDGTRVDSVMFSILAPEWPGVRERLLARIDPLRAIEGSLAGPQLAVVGASVAEPMPVDDAVVDVPGGVGAGVASRRWRGPRLRGKPRRPRPAR